MSGRLCPMRPGALFGCSTPEACAAGCAEQLLAEDRAVIERERPCHVVVLGPDGKAFNPLTFTKKPIDPRSLRRGRGPYMADLARPTTRSRGLPPERAEVTPPGAPVTVTRPFNCPRCGAVFTFERAPLPDDGPFTEIRAFLDYCKDPRNHAPGCSMAEALNR